MLAGYFGWLEKSLLGKDKTLGTLPSDGHGRDWVSHIRPGYDE